MRRLLAPLLATVIALVIGIGALASEAGAAKAKPAWSLKFTGGIAGSATKIKLGDCSQPEPGGNQLNPTANFKVGKGSYQIQIRLDPPLAAGTRPFGATASPTTMTVNVIKSGTASSWTSGDGNGSGTLHSDLKSGSLSGQLIGLGANGIATTVRGRFSCPSFTP